ncbi:response regulator [Flavobacterium sp. MDT1-60]|uniref:response regulator n=1 Tax=Flavobacterium sp. MDT1-60 TaxID=1979344 RepID=UPI001781CDB8|nr:response regulator [Flavobacterium sp. MDT1-60]QOG00660.1 response regulator [Flavobacterium sp. MDT1-60]
MKELYTSEMQNKRVTYSNILQIDDDSDDCELFMEALEAVSAANYTAIYDPVEALRKLMQKEINPDVIFLDLNMPIMSGLEFLTEIKKEKELKEIPIIVFSTSQLDDIIREAKLYGAHDFISKPNNFNDLKRILSQYTFSV